MTIHLSSGSLGSRVRPKHDDTLEDPVLMRAFEPEVADVTLRPSACSNRPRSPLLLTGRSTTSTPCTSTAATTTGGAGPARSVGPDDLGHPTTRHQGPRRQQTTDPARAAMDRRHDRLKHLIGDLMWPTPACTSMSRLSMMMWWGQKWARAASRAAARRWSGLLTQKPAASSALTAALSATAVSSASQCSAITS